MGSERIRAELAAGVSTFQAPSVRELIAELDRAHLERDAANAELAAQGDTGVSAALCVLLDYLTAPEVQEAMMVQALGGRRTREPDGYMLRVRGRDIQFSQPGWQWMWEAVD